MNEDEVLPESRESPIEEEWSNLYPRIKSALGIGEGEDFSECLLEIRVDTGGILLCSRDGRSISASQEFTEVLEQEISQIREIDPRAAMVILIGAQSRRVIQKRVEGDEEIERLKILLETKPGIKSVEGGGE